MMGKTASKINLYSRVETLIDVKDDFSDTIIPAKTQGSIVECYSAPVEGYAVDLAVPDPGLVGGFRYFNLILFPDQFEVMDPEI
jgi:hypothetical protein